MMKENIDWLLIAKHLGKELNEKEKEQFSKMMADSDKNLREVSNAEKFWNASYSKGSNLFNVNRGWEKMRDRIQPGVAKKRQMTVLLLRIAASLLILTLIGSTVYWLAGNSQYVNITAQTSKIISPILLPDGTKVCLNIGSTLKYPKAFTKNTRTVELTGEGYFEVTHNKNKPFIIQTKNARIRVVGTTFNVTAYDNCDSVQVVVVTGTVELSPGINEEAIKLTRGNTGVYYANNHKLLKSAESDINTTSWKTNVLIFKDVNLLYVTKTLSKLFSQSFHFENEKLKNCRVNSDFKDANLDSIIKTINMINKVDITKTSYGYNVTGPGC